MYCSNSLTNDTKLIVCLDFRVIASMGLKIPNTRQVRPLNTQLFVYAVTVQVTPKYSSAEYTNNVSMHTLTTKTKVAISISYIV